MEPVTEKGTLQKSQGHMAEVTQSPHVRLWWCGGVSAEDGAFGCSQGLVRRSLVRQAIAVGQEVLHLEVEALLELEV